MISKKDLNQGYTSYIKDNTESKLETPPDLNTDKKVKKIIYPKGYFSILFITLLTIGVFLLSYFLWMDKVTNPKDEFEQAIYKNMTTAKVVVNSISIALAVGFFLNLLWLISRQLVFTKSKYSSKKMMEVMTFKNMRRKRNLTINSLAVNNITSYYDYEKYCEMKKLTTRLTFWISFITYTILFVISIILTFTIV